MPTKAILFDIDGTRVDNNAMHVTAWLEAFEAIGKSPTRAQIHAQLGKGADMLIPSLYPDADEQMRQKAADTHGDIFKTRYLQQAESFPHAHDLLARAHDSGPQVVLASSAGHDEFDHYLDLLDARALITKTTCSADVEKTKPAPDIFSTALDKLSDIAPEETIVVGNTPYDIEAARKSGMNAIAVRSGGFSDALPEEPGPIAIYDDVAALLAAYTQSALDD